MNMNGDNFEAIEEEEENYEDEQMSQRPVINRNIGHLE